MYIFQYLLRGMNRLNRFFTKNVLLCLMLFFLVGCSSTTTSFEAMIMPPEPENNPVEGVWHVNRSLNSGFISAEMKDRNEWIGKTVEFSKEGVNIAGQFWSKPGYMVTRTDAQEYFMYRYGILLDELDITSKEVFVITISSENKYLYEFVKLNDKDAVMIVQDNVLLMEKTSDKVESFAFEQPDGNEDDTYKNLYSNNKLISSGVLLGIRSEKEKDTGRVQEGEKIYSYKTLWISTENRVLDDILETADIFLPRRSGFWKIEPRRQVKGAYLEDNLKVYTPYMLVARSRYCTEFKTDREDFEEDEDENTFKTIQYISNDYISLEITPSEKNNDGDESFYGKRYKILPVDNTTNTKGMKISEFVGESGELALKKARAELLATLKEQGIEEVDNDIAEENISLTRKMGHWFIKGRMNYKADSNITSADFLINVIPTKELVWYDTLCISWSSIKSRVPGAVDAYTSPNKDIAVIVTGEKLHIYPIADDKLGNNQLASIKLKENDSLVMAEWALGDYVELWEKSFKMNEYKEVKINE